MIRFYCRALPEVEPQLGFDYLEALDKAGLEVRGCPLGPVFLGQPPWNKLGHLFQPVEWKRGEFLNVVCAPPGFLLGQALTQKQIAPDPRIARDREKATTDIVYQPEKAIRGLFVPECPNVAVIPPQAISLEEDEVEMLKSYRLVFCPSRVGAQVLFGLGISAAYAPPDPAVLKDLLMPLIP